MVIVYTLFYKLFVCGKIDIFMVIVYTFVLWIVWFSKDWHIYGYCVHICSMNCLLVGRLTYLWLLFTHLFYELFVYEKIDILMVIVYTFVLCIVCWWEYWYVYGYCVHICSMNCLSVGRLIYLWYVVVYRREFM